MPNEAKFIKWVDSHKSLLPPEDDYARGYREALVEAKKLYEHDLEARAGYLAQQLYANEEHGQTMVWYTWLSCYAPKEKQVAPHRRNARLLIGAGVEA